MREYRQHIGGEWIAADRLFDDLDPYRGTVMARIPAGTRADAARAVDAAAVAFPAWAELPPAEKQAMFLRAADIVARRRRRSSSCSPPRPEPDSVRQHGGAQALGGGTCVGRPAAAGDPGRSRFPGRGGQRRHARARRSGADGGRVLRAARGAVHQLHGFALARQIDAGAVHVNDQTVADEPQLPLGGVKDSGWGRSGPASMADFTELQWITSREGSGHFPI